MAKELDRGRNERKWGFALFLGIMLIHCLAILFFTKGFLLTRSELSQYSQCEDAAESPCFSHPRDGNGSGGCWTKPAVGRLVVIVLDALRFDFVAPSTVFAEKKPWMDKLQVMHELASVNSSSARIFKAIADPPTTSLQRLKGLTTGGLPTFIDVGNSFGAPAITEDNLIYQFVQNGKRVVMMGDDTWVQLFPHHFTESYPFPSFNVKDLDTVDNGCITNLFPTLHEGNWDVLITHFLGVDHAGHIYGVDSNPMIEKLEQYNEIIKKVVEVLQSHSGPGGLHENTMLLVMGDHGQTLNGDHGGGTAEEVETAIFAWSSKNPPTSQPAAAGSSSCHQDMHGRRICIGSIQQLDFAATVSALLGLPFPFGRGAWNMENSAIGDDEHPSDAEDWMQNFVNVLCINSWQVKKYIDVYSSMSLIGFSEKDLLHVAKLYSEARELWSITSKKLSLDKSQRDFFIKRQVDAYSSFLESVAELARSNWTEFNLKMMGIGFCIMLGSLCVHVFLIKKMDKLLGFGSFTKSFGAYFACVAVLIRACSFLSNSYILEEGRVASFLLGTTAILQLHHAMIKKKTLIEALALCLLIPFLRISIELGQLKQAVNSLFLKVDPSRTLGIVNDTKFWTYVAEVMPILALTIVGHLLYKSTTSCSSQGIMKYVLAGTIFNYALIALHWASDSSLWNLHNFLVGVKGNLIPQLTYAAGLLQLLLLAVDQLFVRRNASSVEDITFARSLALLSSLSSTIIILSGKQGPLVVLASIIGGWCLIRLMALEQDAKSDSCSSSLSSALPVIQWSLLAVCMFFSTGHWCAFDGLRYAAAFIGFDEFNLIRGAILLTIDTFGLSHILPILGLPFLIASCDSFRQSKREFSLRLYQVYLMYGLTTAVTTTLTMLCVAIHRRHLMVWGLFAPKFVFDVVGLLLGDLLIFLSVLYYNV
ncbi:uncharacterized protein LOC127248244 isoform X2 [Andrographis paniculata]|uniref:uncharacterized protein LOC127248244 isoform X2 n=1 Tax=Andrographis paniculata TaxID=175694 RepID=UPI0021E87D0E|nr:uncharacterized protein LOC127248244 isoform X2 [Andrographis paniculata]